MWIKGLPIIHIFKTPTGSKSAIVLSGRSPSDILFSFVERWASIYTGYLNVIRLDQESGIAAKAFRDLAMTHSIKLQY